MATSHSILALAAFLQQQLDVLVVTAEFFPGRKRPRGLLDPPAETPSSLITLEPFCPGGLRRLVLNVHNPLIHKVARALQKGHESAVQILGQSMIWSASWPIPYIDGDVSVHFNMTRGLIATPLFVWPVPHQPLHCHTNNNNNNKPLHTRLVIWPRRICLIEYRHNYLQDDNSSNNNDNNQKRQIQHVGELWRVRDDALLLELQHVLQQEKGGSRRQWIHKSIRQRSKHQTKEEDTMAVLPSSALLTYAPCLPVVCLAHVLVQSGNVPRHSALAQAADFLVRKDRLFALSLFFGVPLIDRTRIIDGALQTAPLARPPPTLLQVEQFCQRLSIDTGGHNDPDNRRLCHESLHVVMLQRALELWSWAETPNNGASSKATTKPGYMYVAWSGGIDSTAVLCALLETASQDSTRRIRVILDKESIAENPGFYQNIVVGKQLEQVPRDDKPLSWHEHRIRQENKASILVTGELGDQLFGSDRCKAAFPDAYTDKVQDLPASQTKNALQSPPSEFKGVFVEKGLGVPWEETILPSLQSVGLIAEGGFGAWKDWIAPQLAVAPFPIVSTYDFLWWLNFSMKWQNVSLRCLHDGGEPILAQAKNIADLTGCIHHFYDDHDLECWSCVQAFHQCKFPEMTNWTTYKEPLKYFIKQFDGDETYYRDKKKVGSLCFGAPCEADSYVQRFYGAFVNLIPQSEQATCHTSHRKGADCLRRIDPVAKPMLLTWGVCGVLSPEGNGLEHLVHVDVLSALRCYLSDTADAIYVDPWSNASLVKSPFDLAPYFAEDDERQRRVFNPVTQTTLTGKCAALLTRDVLEGRTFLDLGSCLGASTHWALCMGARRAIAVEVQESFCERAQAMLEKAEAQGCWPELPGENGSRFKVVCCGVREFLSKCENSSHDVILAAGLLHCFVDPIQVLVDMARVASQAVLIEMIHPALYLNGYLDDPDQEDGFVHDGLHLSVRPTKRSIEQAGLLQVAPGALVNLADSDASFAGLSILPSRLAIESTMKNLGFEVSRVFLKEHPTSNDEVLTYTGPRNGRALSIRYFLQCVRKTAAFHVRTRSLETLVLSNDQTRSVPWKDATSWFSYDSEVSCTKQSADKELPNNNPAEKWEFDENVAKRFELEARCHIPDYEEVIDDSIRLLEDYLKQSASEPKELIKVVDVGCATGQTLLQLLKQGFRNVHGVDLSMPMIERAREKLQLIGFDAKHARLHLSKVVTDLPDSLGDDLGAVFINWTLQFVWEEVDRKRFLRNIANQMRTGAFLVLTEKTVQNSLTKNAYYAFKKKMGVTEEEIAVKEARLKGVLKPFDLRWYLDALSDCGFIDISVYRARYGFVTLLAKKEEAVLESGPGIEETAPTDKFQIWPNLSISAKDVWYQAEEKLAPFGMRAWGQSTGSTWTGGSEVGTVYGYVYEGPTELTIVNASNSRKRVFSLYEGMYFSCPGQIQLQGGCGVLQTVDDHKAMFAIGGPVEEGDGRLPYIDGCTDTLLLAPAVKGAPCLNHLHFPPGIVQTRHTHPSGRSGMVVRGKGTCVCDDGGTLRRTTLEPGIAFIIPAHVVHAFETTDDQELDVIAFHPDSDFGPSFDDHPMINRTIVDVDGVGVAASRISSIQTQV